MDPASALEQLQALPEYVLYLGALLWSAVPFIESQGVSALGVLLGMWPPLVILLGILGNGVAVAVIIWFAERIHAWRVRRKPSLEANPTRRQLRLRSWFDKWGIPICALAGPVIFPSHFTALMLVSFGARKKPVAIWMAVSIIAWAVVAGVSVYFTQEAITAELATY